VAAAAGLQAATPLAHAAPAPPSLTQPPTLPLPLARPRTPSLLYCAYVHCGGSDGHRHSDLLSLSLCLPQRLLQWKQRSDRGAGLWGGCTGRVVRMGD
jgi:hypothetical protein